jgi:hypothetical protein
MIDAKQKRIGGTINMKNELNALGGVSKDTLPVTGSEQKAYALVDVKNRIYRVCTQEEKTTAIGDWLAEMAKENSGEDDFTIVVVKAL